MPGNPLLSGSPPLSRLLDLQAMLQVLLYQVEAEVSVLPSVVAARISAVRVEDVVGSRYLTVEVFVLVRHRWSWSV